MVVILALAGVVLGGGLLLNHLSKRPRPEHMEMTDRVPEKPELPEPLAAAEEKNPPPPQKGKKTEQEREEAARTQTGVGTRIVEAPQPGSKSDEARRGPDRDRTKTLEEQFQRHMSIGLTAYHEGNYPLARSELTKARELKPDAQEVAGALAQVEAAIRLQSIGDFKAGAAEAEAAEEWGKASDLYDAALKLDHTLQFAVQGRDRTLERIEMDKRLQFYLQKPEALESDEYLARASELLNRAEGIDPKGPRLNHQVETFRRLLKEAQNPIKVTFISDNLTEVSVYRVGKLGRFTARDLLLRPGKYTIVGTRDGYKDVRQEIIVKPGGASLRVDIACREEV
jgi:tetratricopeptide (TPR) repeat protein